MRMAIRTPRKPLKMSNTPRISVSLVSAESVEFVQARLWQLLLQVDMIVGVVRIVSWRLKTSELIPRLPKVEDGSSID